jgi:voltage-gated sodium channel
MPPDSSASDILDGTAKDSGWSSRRARLRELVEGKRFQAVIIGLIAFNSVVLGLETSAAVMAKIGGPLIFVDRIVLGIFVVELTLRITAFGWRFFRDPWNIFDFVVVGIALVPASGPFAVLRALRVLRVLRLISTVPRMRRVVQALMTAIPGMGAIIALLMLLFYVGAVIATKLYGGSFPEWFGTLGESLYTLFQVMTLESWSMGIVRPVLEVHPYAWLFFVPFILVTAFTMLNLFIAVIVNAMQSQHDDENRAADEAAAEAARGEREILLAEIRAIRVELSELRQDGRQRLDGDGG